MSERFVPPHPPRPPRPVATWRGFIGERARTAVYGWSDQAYEVDGFTRQVLGFRIHVINRPEWIGEALLDHAEQLTKPDIVRKILAPSIGEGLLTAEDELWRAERRIVAASFTPGAVEGHRPVFEHAAAATSGAWTSGEVRDIAGEATRTTLTVIALALFGSDDRLTSSESLGHIAAALEGFSQPRMQALLGLPRVPIGRRAKAGERGRIYLRDTLGQIIDQQRLGSTWLGGLVTALEDSFGAVDGRRLAIDNALTFYLAGHETTANALSWTLYLLSRQPELQETLAAEARAALSKADWPTAGITARLPRLHAALQESLRLYPPAPRFDRQARAALRIGDHDVRPGDLVSIWPWLVHRNRQRWDDPDAFRADRFLSGERHRFQYIPFGAGPRICVGAQFAMIEALTILATWLAEWRFLSIGAAVKVSGLVTLRPSPGVTLKLVRRL